MDIEITSIGKQQARFLIMEARRKFLNDRERDLEDQKKFFHDNIHSTCLDNIQNNNQELVYINDNNEFRKLGIKSPPPMKYPAWIDPQIPLRNDPFFEEANSTIGKWSFAYIFGVEYIPVEDVVTSSSGMIIIDGYRIDVKTTPYQNGSLICAPWQRESKEKNYDLFALMVGEPSLYNEPSFYKLKGYQPPVDLFKHKIEGGPDDKRNGKSKFPVATYASPQSELIDFHFKRQNYENQDDPGIQIKTEKKQSRLF